jgi:hypothetical protein
LTVYPEIRLSEELIRTKKYLHHSKRTTDTNIYRRIESWIAEDISTSEVLDSLYTYTKRMGADAVVRLKIEMAESKTSGAISVPSIKASGFAIKRK